MITTIPFKVIRIGEDGFHLIIKISISGKSAHVIVDTGASKTVFDKKRIQKYVSEKKFNKHEGLSVGMGTNKIKSEFTPLKKLEIGTLKIVNYTCVLMDLSTVNKSYEELGIKPIEGVLGSDILMQFNAVIDYKKQSLKLTYKKTEN